MSTSLVSTPRSQSESHSQPDELSLPLLPGGQVLRLTPANFSDAGIGAIVWPGDTAMCDWLRQNASDVARTSVLSLACGIGSTGLYAAGLRASRVVLADRNEAVLERAQRNVGLNAEALAGVDVSTTPFEMGAEDPPEGPWDWVLASDVNATDRPQLRALSRTVRDLLAAQRQPPRVILTIAHRHRGGQHLPPTFAADTKGLRAETLALFQGASADEAEPDEATFREARDPEIVGWARERQVAVAVVELRALGHNE